MSSPLHTLNSGPISGASQLPFFDPTNGAARRTSLAALANVIQGLMDAPTNGLVTQYAAPVETGYVITITPPLPGSSVFLLISPALAFAAGSIVLPSGVDEQEIVVHSRQALAALTLVPQADQVVFGTPTSLGNGGFFRLRFDGPSKTWCRVG